MTRGWVGRALLGVLSASVMALPSCSTDRPAAAPLKDRIAEVVTEQLALDSSFDAVRGVVVTVEGETVFEDYPGSTRLEYHSIMSITKSIMGTLIGIALEEGLITGLDEPLSVLLPDYADHMSPALRAATLREVLTMTAGMAGEEDRLGNIAFMEAADPVAAALRDTVRPPGQEFEYSSGGSHVLAAVLREATGMSVLEYARPKLFTPLGIDTQPALEAEFAWQSRAFRDADFAWPVDTQGLHLGWGMVRLRPSDLVNIGRLYLDRGRWRGEQLVDEDWVEEATKAQVPLPDESASYGFHWYVDESSGHPAFLAYGYGGQALRVVPELDPVLVTATEVNLTETRSYGVSDSAMLHLLDQVVAEVGAPQ